MTTRQQNAISDILGIDGTDNNAILAAGLANQRLSPFKIKKITCGRPQATTVNDTGFDLPVTGLVLDVWVNVRTAEATASTKTIDVGLLASESGGDEDGFLDGVSVAAVANVSGTFTYTGATNSSYITAQTYGVLMYQGVLGGAATGSAGTVARRNHILNGTAKSLTYTLGSNNMTEFVGDIYVAYVDLTLA